MEVKAGEREVLSPLFVDLRDKRMLFMSPAARMDTAYVTRSISDVRQKLATALASLGPHSAVSPWLEKLRTACREYLDIMSQKPMHAEPDAEYESALAEVLEACRVVAGHVASMYRLPVARHLADEIRGAQAGP